MTTTRVTSQPEAATRHTVAARTPRDLALGIGGLILVNGGMALFGLWTRESLAWVVIAALLNFAAVVVIAEAVGRWVPVRYKRAYERGLAVGFPILLAVGWELLVANGILNERWFPPPTQVAVALWDLTVTYDRFQDTSLLGRPWLIPSQFGAEGAGWAGVQALFAESHVYATLSRVFGGFMIGALPGIVVGIVMGINKTVRTMLDTTLSAIYVLPKIAIFPIMMLIFPNPFGEGPKIAVVAISAFFLVAINTMAGVAEIDEVYLQAGRNYGANRLQMFRHVIIPAASPVIFAGLRLALGTALIVIVAVEFVRATKGVGYLVYYNWQVGSTDKMYAGLFVVMLLGVLLTYSLQWAERWVMPWKRK
jgi:ABC-type nitrate/sulfonate/bicarbonate transport system permease component